MGIQSLSQEAPVEKEMATHSSILAWEIPWTEGLAHTQAQYHILYIYIYIYIYI